MENRFGWEVKKAMIREEVKAIHRGRLNKDRMNVYRCDLTQDFQEIILHANDEDILLILKSCPGPFLQLNWKADLILQRSQPDCHPEIPLLQIVLRSFRGHLR